tara:strand:+ start:36993 stop:38108 length:1116 start_codon:yes stop_codon:yes gene_type:complete
MKKTKISYQENIKKELNDVEIFNNLGLVDSILLSIRSDKNNDETPITKKKISIKRKVLYTCLFLSVIVLAIFEINSLSYNSLAIFSFFTLCYLYFVAYNNIEKFDHNRRFYLEYLIEKYGDKKDKKELRNILSLKYKIFSFINNIPKKPSYFLSYSYRNDRNYQIIKKLYEDNCSNGYCKDKLKYQLKDRVCILYHQFVSNKIENILKKHINQKPSLSLKEIVLLKKVENLEERRSLRYSFYYSGITMVSSMIIDSVLETFTEDKNITEIFYYYKKLKFLENYAKKNFEKFNVDLSTERMLIIFHAYLTILMISKNANEAHEKILSINNMESKNYEKTLLKEVVDNYYREYSIIFNKKNRREYFKFLQTGK